MIPMLNDTTVHLLNDTTLNGNTCICKNANTVIMIQISNYMIQIVHNVIAVRNYTVILNDTIPTTK